MNSYTEYSLSGTGLHILSITDLDNIGNRKKISEDCMLEMYNHRRYFTYTGNVFRNYSTIAVRTEAFKAIHTQYFSKPAKETVSPLQPPMSPLIYQETPEASEQELLDKIN